EDDQPHAGHDVEGGTREIEHPERAEKREGDGEDDGEWDGGALEEHAHEQEHEDDGEGEGEDLVVLALFELLQTVALAQEIASGQLEALQHPVDLARQLLEVLLFGGDGDVEDRLTVLSVDGAIPLLDTDRRDLSNGGGLIGGRRDGDHLEHSKVFGGGVVT